MFKLSLRCIYKIQLEVDGAFIGLSLVSLQRSAFYRVSETRLNYPVIFLISASHYSSVDFLLGSSSIRN